MSIKNLDMRYEFRPNSIYCGDNLLILSKFPDDCFNLIYIDPPFFSNESYEIIWNDGYEIEVFEDRWKGGIQHYLSWMKSRLEEIYRVLKENGSFYLHCDWHSNSYLRILCDELFGYNSLKSQIIWKRYPSVSITSKGISYITDTILYYRKSSDYIFNPIYLKIDAKDFPFNEKETGRKFNHIPLIKKGTTNQTLNFKEKKITVKKNQRFVWSQERLNQELQNNPYCIYWTKNGNPRFKKYLDEYKGKRINNLWTDIEGVTSKSNERIGYPTQKPEALLERIIKMSSNKGDLIGDFFCGCGTSITVAKRLKRRYIGIDVSPLACKIMAERIGYDPKEIIGMKFTLDDLKSLDPFHFQKWAVERIGGIMSKRKTGDMGIDGRIPSNQYGTNLPIEVKQQSITRPTIDKLETVLRRTKKKYGYVIGMKITKGATEEIARCKNEDGLIIFAIEVKDLI